MLVKKSPIILTLILLVFFIPMMSGCYTPAGRSAGEVIDDSTIATKVKAKLFDSSELSGFAINVDTFEQVVTLTGAVETEQQRELATEIAESVKGVQSVNNLLGLK
ncbi:BON domain-containing protein [Desulfopila inferna]|uniref:BON domain-containing protein n=1 Tax=Desulfopila inferna TaxID=468528 RepID=UPI0019635AF6|nr:BON domain-containing protein [Desulfopila inferna]MBM9604933.1 BON domain-containing protein [Desulfopila inferna]